MLRYGQCYLTLPECVKILFEFPNNYAIIYVETSTIIFFLQLHSDNVGIQAEKLENLRISIAKGSPMWETLEFCIEFADSQSLELLVPRLAQLVRSGVGLNTRYFISILIKLRTLWIPLFLIYSPPTRP